MESDFGRADQEFLKRLVRAGVKLNHVYDVGASNGYWSWMMSKVVPNATFDLFEPNESEQYVDTLNTVMAQRPDFRIHRIGLGDCDTTLTLNLQSDHAGSSMLDWDNGGGKKQVPVRRLDGFVDEFKLPAPDLIKMDTQGFELKILQGGEIACRGAKALILESWLYPAYGGTPLLGDLIKWLEPRGLILTAFGDSWAHPDQRLFSIDAYFLRSDMAAQVAAAENPPAAAN